MALAPWRAAPAGAGSLKRRCSRWHPATTTTAMTSPSTAGAAASGKREDIERPALARVLREVLHGVDEAQRRRAVAGIEVVRHDGPRPSAHAGEHRHVLLAIWTPIGDRLADDAGVDLVSPEHVAPPG